MAKDTATLNADLDLIYAPSGALGYVAILDNSAFTGTFTVNTTTDVVTTSTAHGLVTGTRVRLTTTGTLPASTPAVAAATDYYVIFASSTTLQLATTLANAIAATAINFTSTGSGTHTLTEQALSVNDPIGVLVNHEMKPATHPNYVRQAIEDIGSAVNGAKPVVAWTLSITTGNPSFTYKHLLFILGSFSTPGDTTGTKDHLFSEASAVTVTAGSSKAFNFVLKFENG